MKLNRIIKETLYEEKDTSLNIFYSSDIFVRRTENQMQAKKEEDQPEPEEEQPEEEQPEEQPEEQEESVSTRDTLLAEETFRSKTEGVIEVPDEDAKTILTLSDLLAYVNRLTDKSGKQIISDLVVEIVEAMSEGAMDNELSSLVFKGDKINAIIDYGIEKEDSVGFQLNKNSGVEDISLVMRQNSAAITGNFNKDFFKRKITNIFLPEIN